MAADFEVFSYFFGETDKEREGDVRDTFKFLKAHIAERGSLNCLEVRDVVLDKMSPAAEWFATAQEAMIQAEVYKALDLANAEWVYPGTDRQIILDRAIITTDKILEILR